MFKYHKKNKKTGTKAHLHKSLIDYSPFDMRDKSYLEHLHKELKLRNAREAMVSFEKRHDGKQQSVPIIKMK